MENATTFRNPELGAADKGIAARFILQKHWWGKATHYDIRIWTKGGNKWFGWTFKNQPWIATVNKKVQAFPKGNANESFSDMSWTKIWKKITIKAGEPGNPAKDFDAFMQGIDRGDAIINRKESDFLDITFKGSKIKGRYFIRSIKGKDKSYAVIWKAKEQKVEKEEDKTEKAIYDYTRL